MHVLWVFRLRRAKKKKACHTKLCDDISDLVPLYKPQCDALAVSLHTYQHRTVIPRERGQSFPNNIRSSHSTLVELRAEEMNPYLSGNDFGFRQFRHREMSPMKWCICAYALADCGKTRFLYNARCDITHGVCVRITSRMLKMAVQQGRSERRSEAYASVR
jgi:hypothetical protein